MANKLKSNTHPARIFGFSAAATVITLVGIVLGMGLEALTVAVILILVELTFSFENAIINAKILANMSDFWQKMFLTVGILIAIVGMRILFPIVIVMVTAGLGFSEVVDLAFNHPEQYAAELESAHPQIAAFGGAFLLMLALHFFLDDERETLWLKRIEGHMQRYATFWMPALVSVITIICLALIPANDHKQVTLVAGFAGVALYSLMHLLIRFFESLKKKREKQDSKEGISKRSKQVGMAAFMSFLYLEMLDASFSFDSVIGAFAVTDDVILIALGLGVGAIWVRSLTVFMVRNGTLNTYKYLEHGAHYTVFVLSAVLLLGIFWHIPELWAGIVGIGLIVSAIIASREVN